MAYFGHFYLDKEKDIIVDLDLDDRGMHYVLRTPNHRTGNLITNLAHVCQEPLSLDENGMKVIRGEVPAYYDAQNRLVYNFRLGRTKCASIWPDGRMERKASVPAIAKTLMSQTRDYHLDYEKTIVKTWIRKECKFRTDLHTHMNANLNADVLMALGIVHQIRYPLYYIRKLQLKLSEKQEAFLDKERQKTAEKWKDSELTGKYLERKINDNTFLNFADLILNNLDNAAYNIPRIRASLAVMKDGQAVFTNLEKVYLYRYVFTRGIADARPVELKEIGAVPDEDIVRDVHQMLADSQNPSYAHFSLYQNELLWIARTYAAKGICYAEISDTSLVKKSAGHVLQEIHDAMPAITQETGVRLRFLAAIRRIPLTIVRDQSGTYRDVYENLQVLQAVSADPYVAGSDIVGEEINDIRDLKPQIAAITSIASGQPYFTIRIHAGENDSLRDNVYYAVKCVHDSLKEGQKMPHMRIGHGLYTAGLHSARGKRLLRILKENDVTLEFQITSNVRLNNLSSLKNHPLKTYLENGIDCVQGTDGGAIYGTDSMDEQLALEKMLDLSHEDLMKMRDAEEKELEFARRSWKEKSALFAREKGDRPVEEVINARIACAPDFQSFFTASEKRYDTKEVLREQIRPLPEEKLPVILCGGSFNSDAHRTRMNREEKKLIDEILKTGDPQRMFFVIGHRLQGYEKYLFDQNEGRFEIYSFVPAVVKKNEMHSLQKKNLWIRPAIESSGMGTYKSIAYEIFKRRTSVLLALDGNSAGSNLIQEANNSRYECRIFIDVHASVLRKKAETLDGYMTLFKTNEVMDEIRKYIPVRGEEK